MEKRLVFLKLGGSVITDKDRPNSADLVRIQSIAAEIRRAVEDDPGLTLLIGHGSGSFGHHAANKYGTRDGVKTPQDRQGFCEVALRAAELNQILTEQLVLAGISALSVSPFSGILSSNRKITSWDTAVIKECLAQNLVPVIYGDVILDRQLGGTILSTEELFAWLALKFRPDQILLAGLEEGVWKDFPARTQLYTEINPLTFNDGQSQVQSSASTDVTGGMRSKVESMVALVRQAADLEVVIFSGQIEGNVYSTLKGEHRGTLIRKRKG